VCLEFSILNFQFSIAAFRPGGRKGAPPIIGWVCVFDAKFYKIVGGIFDVTCCWIRNKKNFKIFDFCSALPSFLIAQNSFQPIGSEAEWRHETNVVIRIQFLYYPGI
jgi:hypothetical protein